MGAHIAEFGALPSGFIMYRIGGTKLEIAEAMEELEAQDIQIQSPIEIVKASHNSWSALIRLKMPEPVVEPEVEPEVEHEKDSWIKMIMDWGQPNHKGGT